MADNNHDPYSALRSKEFALFIIGRMCVSLAIQIQTVVVGWQIYDLTGDALYLGLIGLVEAVPNISVALYAGHIADKSRRRTIILVCLGILAFCSFALLTFTMDIIRQPNTRLVWMIFSVIFISGLARGFISPALFSFMSQLVAPRQYMNAMTWHTTTWQFASMAGPALGGLLYGFIGIKTAYTADFFLVLISIFLILQTKHRELPAAPEGKAVSIFHELTAGIRFVFRHQIILGALSLDLFAVLFGGAAALLPIFARDILKTGPEGLGLLQASPAVGAFLMALFLAHRPMAKNAGRILLMCVSGFGLCMLFFALSRNFFLSMGLLALSGAFDNVSVVIRHTIVQQKTPEHMKGRVSAVNNIFIGSSNEIGAFESGLAAKLLGVVPSVIMGAVLTQIVVMMFLFFAPKLRNLDMSPPGAEG